jgi:hypothetical protein
MKWKWSLLLLVSFGGLNLRAQDSGSPAREVNEKLNELSAMREGLASGLLQQDLKKQAVTLETFQAVCAPVGKELKRWATEKGFEARQISHKARNPGNRLPPEFQSYVTKWKKKPKDLSSAYDFKELESGGFELVKPIYVTQACLVCHGEKANRPAFIVEKYPEDQAYGFKPGELRGFFLVRGGNTQSLETQAR